MTELSGSALLDFNKGDTLLLIATISSACHIVMMGTLAQDSDPVFFNTIQAVVDVTFISPLHGQMNPQLHAVSLQTLLIAFITGFYAIGILFDTVCRASLNCLACRAIFGGSETWHAT